MSSRDDPAVRPGEQAGDEPFLSRWARLKQESRERPPEAAPPQPAPATTDPAGEQRVEAADGALAEVPAQDPPVELPPLESLTEESDFGPFMQVGVDPDLRRQALRKMFRNAKYAVVDPLDPYRADFGAFTPLGDIVTAEMRFHAERLLREQLEKAAEGVEAGDLEAGQADAEGSQPAATATADANEDSTTHTTETGDERRDG
jgi:hypothetical protein